MFLLFPGLPCTCALRKESLRNDYRDAHDLQHGKIHARAHVQGFRLKPFCEASQYQGWIGSPHHLQNGPLRRPCPYSPRRLITVQRTGSTPVQRPLQLVPEASFSGFVMRIHTECPPQLIHSPFGVPMKGTGLCVSRCHRQRVHRRGPSPGA